MWAVAGRLLGSVALAAGASHSATRDRSADCRIAGWSDCRVAGLLDCRLSNVERPAANVESARTPLAAENINSAAITWLLMQWNGEGWSRGFSTSPFHGVLAESETTQSTSTSTTKVFRNRFGLTTAIPPYTLYHIRVWVCQNKPKDECWHPAAEC